MGIYHVTLQALHMAERWLSAWGLAAIAFGSASLIVPLYVVELGGDAFDLGILFATGSLVGVPGALVFGNLADRTGKRRVFVLAAMAITVGTMVVFPFLERISLVVVTNALLWFGFAATTPVLTLLVVASEPEDQWSTLIARLNKFQGIGWATGLALGFVIVAGSTRVVDSLTAQRLVFLSSATSAGVGLLLGVRTLPPDPDSAMEPSPRRLRTVVRKAGRFNIRGAGFPFSASRFDARNLRPRRFLERFSPQLGLYFVAVLVAFTGFGVFFAPLPTYLSDAGFDSSAIFGLYLLLNVGAAAFFGQAARLADKYEVAHVHIGGLLTRGLTMPLVAVLGVAVGGSVAQLGAIGILFLSIGLSWAVIAVTAATLVTTLAPAAIRGEALGVYGALLAVGGGIGGLLGGWLAGMGYVVAFGVAGGLVVTGAALVLSLRTTPK